MSVKVMGITAGRKDSNSEILLKEMCIRDRTRTMGTSCFISHVPRQPPLPGALRPPSLPVSYRPRRHPAISRTSC